jgi:sirohydrochlorin ferrochelatase
MPNFCAKRHAANRSQRREKPSRMDKKLTNSNGQEREGRSTGLLLVGHGTRDPVGLAEFAEVTQLVAQLAPHYKVGAAYLELATPTISDEMDRLIGAGVERIIVCPLLLFAAGHAKDDVPAEIRAVSQRYPQVKLSIAQPLGCHPKLLELSVERFCSAYREVAGSEGADALAGGGFPRCVLLLVGRGSSDAGAVAEMQRYARLLAERIRVGRHAVAFVARAMPCLSEALEAIARQPGEVLIVQPHLLFAGEVLREVAGQVAEFTRRFPARNVRMAGHLGPSRMLAEALLHAASLA